MSYSYDRPRRFASQLRTALGDVLTKGTRDPRFVKVVISAVEVSRDLSSVKVFISLLPPTELDPVVPNIAKTVSALNKARPYFRTLLAKALNRRRTPALRFFYDAELEKERSYQGILPEDNDLPLAS